MNCDRVNIEDPPEYTTRHEHDDTPEQLGDSFEISAEERERLTIAAQRGPRAVRMALAGDAEAMAEMRRLHIVRWDHAR